jgi:hypothetical protein
MKKMIIGILAMTSLSAFAARTEVVCSVGNTPDIKQEINELNILVGLRKNVKQVSEVKIADLRDGNTMACVTLISEGITKK